MIVELIKKIASFSDYFMDRSTRNKYFLKLFKPWYIPGHVGFIMDGNRRFAKKNGLPIKEGHILGAKALADALETCFELGIKEISIYAFSIENFKRPKTEVDDLLALLKEKLEKVAEKEWAEAETAQIRIVGNKALIDPEILEHLEKIEKESKGFIPKICINVCFAYTSRDEIAHSIREVALKRGSQCLSKADINERMLSDNFYTGNSSRPLDLLIRTSGHTRMSDFLLWQCASNCSIVFSHTLWPHFTFWELYVTILKWSFEQTLAYNRHLCWQIFSEPVHVTLRSLPESPPFASVGQCPNAIRS